MTPLKLHELLNELEEKANAATPGPWQYDYGNWEVESENEAHYRVPIAQFSNQNRHSHYEQFDLKKKPIDVVEDAEFIAAANPEMIKKLVIALRHCKETFSNSCGCWKEKRCSHCDALLVIHKIFGVEK